MIYLYVNHKNMRKLFNIDQDEKNRILEMHENATKRHYLNEYSGVAFGDEQNGLKIEKVETKEQTAPVQPNTREEIVKQAMNMFPDPQWYASIAGKEISAAVPNAIKAFNLARRFFDSNIPQLSLNQGADFFEYMKQNNNYARNFIIIHRWRKKLVGVLKNIYRELSECAHLNKII